MNLHLFLRDPCTCLHRRVCTCAHTRRHAHSRKRTDVTDTNSHSGRAYANTRRHGLQRDTQRCTRTYGQTRAQAHTDTYTDGHARIGHTYMQTHTNSDAEMHKGRQRCTEMCRPSLSHRCHSYLSETSLSLSAWDVVVAAGSQDE